MANINPFQSFEHGLKLPSVSNLSTPFSIILLSFHLPCSSLYFIPPFVSENFPSAPPIEDINPSNTLTPVRVPFMFLQHSSSVGAFFIFSLINLLHFETVSLVAFDIALTTI